MKGSIHFVLLVVKSRKVIVFLKWANERKKRLHKRTYIDLKRMKKRRKI